MIENLIQLKDYVPIFQSLIWIFFISIILVIFNHSIKNLLENIINRMKKGSSIKIGPVELGEDLKNLQSTAILQNNITAGSNGVEREKHRMELYKKNKDLFLTHIFLPSKIDGFYDIFIYLIRHKSKDLSNIKYVEFFFGHMWGNKVFKIENDKKLIGITTSAYAPFLCTCLVKFKDDTEIELNRYIDFEMGIKKILNNIKQI